MDAYLFIDDLDLATLDAVAELDGVRLAAPTFGDHAAIVVIEAETLDGLHDVVGRVRASGATSVRSRVAANPPVIPIPPLPIPSRRDKAEVVAYLQVDTGPGDAGFFLNAVGEMDGVIGASFVLGGSARYLLELTGPDLDSVIATQERIRLLAGGSVTGAVASRNQLRGEFTASS